MKRMGWIFLLTSGILYSTTSFTQAEESKNCKIIVTQTSVNGEIIAKTHFINQKNKKACEQAAKLHETNFEPAFIKQKKVSFKWLGN
jgi:hypothetical protein